MPTSAGESPEAAPREPIFEIPQRDGAMATIDLTTPGAYGDFALTARIPEDGGGVTKRIFGAYHTSESRIFVQILQHWARVAPPADIAAGLDRVAAVLSDMTAGMGRTSQSENTFGYLIRSSIDPLANSDVLPVDHEHSDEFRNVIVLAPRGSDLTWISHRGQQMSFTVPPSHLWTLVTGMVWRSYRIDFSSLTRLNTDTYEAALDAFRRAIEHRVTVSENPGP